MKEELEFVERQRFKKWWIILTFILVNGFFGYVCIFQIGLGQLQEDNPMSDLMLIVFIAIINLVFIVFFTIRLDTLINKEGVYFRMFPFHLTIQFKPWEQISEAVVIKYNPIRTFDGWGIRFKILNIGGHGIYYGLTSKSFTIAGNKVLSLTLFNNRKIYIGTQRPEDLSEFLIKLDAKRKQK
jgi:hypothetical protein